jgi:hypothetical protein
MLVLIICALAFYRKFATNTKVAKKEVPENVRSQPEFESM